MRQITLTDGRSIPASRHDIDLTRPSGKSPDRRSRPLEMRIFGPPGARRGLATQHHASLSAFLDPDVRPGPPCRSEFAFLLI
ncbi:hypothetical protein RPB_3856 [Rhodopseudomonas palustris HaA2]|uniref:Uncharacterized protein n=1 Tax=Rhodopseudomonas palustris (strain HaA2) TaxID=316058 RepID=Q2ITB1_RHOP2|nr:hypothetical protein RPB_3856 [Rhodopseudomonas palustris HaA2]